MTQDPGSTLIGISSMGGERVPLLGDQLVFFRPRHPEADPPDNEPVILCRKCADSVAAAIDHRHVTVPDRCAWCQCCVVVRLNERLRAVVEAATEVRVGMETYDLLPVIARLAASLRALDGR